MRVGISRRSARQGGGREGGQWVQALERRAMLTAMVVTLATLDPSGGQAAPRVAVDAKGNVFGARGPTGTDVAETIFEIPAGSSTPVTLASFGDFGGLTEDPDTIGIDSAGDLFVTDESNAFNSLLGQENSLWELPAGSSTVKHLGAYRDTALRAVDAAGDAFLYGYTQPTDANLTVFRYDLSTGATSTLFAGVPVDADPEIAISDTGDDFATFPDPSGSGATDVYRQPGTGASGELGQIAAADGTVVELAADAGGDLFATTSSGNVVEVTAGGTFSQVGSLGSTTAGGFIETPVVDAAGDLFSLAANGASDSLVELAAGSKAVTVLGSTPTEDSTGDQSLEPLAVNSAGDVYCAISNDATVTVLTVSDVGVPGLSATTGKTTVPATVVAGTKIKGSVTVKLANTGPEAFKGTETVRLYADTAGQANADGTLVGTARHGTVGGGGSATVPVKLRPVALPSGSYTLTAVVTNTTGDVVATVSGPAVTVVPATVMLSATITKVSSATTAPDKSLSFTLTVTNDGTAATTGTASVAVFLSADGSQDTVAVAMVRGVPKSPKVAADRSVSYRVTILVPADAAGMELYPLVMFGQDGPMTTAVAKTDVTVA